MSKLLLERFEEKIERIPECGCWIWMGATLGRGYGHTWDGKRRCTAHRLAWKIYFGEIPEGNFVLHRCDTPSCVNPHHLFLGTNQDNIRDAAIKRRLNTCQRNEDHPAAMLTDDQVRSIRSSSGSQYSIAKEFGVTQGTICRIISRNTWKNLI